MVELVGGLQVHIRDRTLGQARLAAQGFTLVCSGPRQLHRNGIILPRHCGLSLRRTNDLAQLSRLHDYDVVSGALGVETSEL